MLLNKNGEKLSENDLQFLEEMLAGSIRNHIERLISLRDSEGVEDPDFYKPIINVYEEGLAFLSLQLKEAAESEEPIDTADFIRKMYEGFGKDALDVVDQDSPEIIDLQNLVTISWGEKHLLQGIAKVDPLDKDTVEGYEKTASAFHFSGRKLEGIEDIVSYDPDKDRVKGLYEGRSGNSTTLSRSKEELQIELDAIPDNEENQRRRASLQKRIEDFEKGTIGLHVGAEVAKQYSSELRDKKTVSFGDVYQAYSEINRALRPGDADGGKMRGKGVTAGTLEGVGASMVPEAVFKTMQTIADGMNAIKNTQDPALKKSMAVELSAFAYQMTLSEHAFMDGNGRTCRLFADTILQTFGLPPHIPTEEEKTIPKTMGNEMDFSKGAEVFLNGVKKSSDLLAAERALETKKGVIGEPGEITARVRDYLRIRQEMNDAPVPDALAQPGEYLAHRSRLRAEARKTNAIREALLAAPVSDEQWDTAYYAVLGNMTGKRELPGNDKLEEFAEALEVRMTPEQKKAVTDAINAYRDPMDLPAEEKVDYPYREKAEELKANIPAEIAANQDLKAQYEHSLEFAAKHLTQAKEAVRADLLGVDKDIQRMENDADNYVKDVLRPQYENGKFENVTVKDRDTGITRFGEGKEAVFDEIVRDGIKLSDKTKEGYRLIFEKMNEMGLHTYPYAENGEDGAKTYSFNKLVADRQAFEEAMDSGDPGRIMSAQIVYEKTLRDYDEIFKIAKEHFSQDPGLFPGNMDSIRNPDVPFEFAGNMQTAAQVNSVFQAFISTKTKGVDSEEYLANPTGEVMKEAVDKLKPVSFQEVSKGLSLTESLDLLAGVGEYEETADDVRSALPTILYARQINTANLLETDPQLKQRNDAVAYTMSNDVINDVMVEGQNHRFGYFRRNETPAGNRHMMQTLKNLMLATDEERNLNAMFDGEPERDQLGHKIGEGFDTAEHINRKPLDYEGILERTEKLIKRCDKYSDFSGIVWFARDDRMRQVAAELYLEVLIAHPEDADKPEYKKMQEALNRTYDAIAVNASEGSRERAEVQKEVAAQMLEENNTDYRIRHDPAAYLGALEAEAKSTGDYTKYAEGLLKVQMVDQEIKDDTELHKRPMTLEERQFSKAYSDYNDRAFDVLDPNDKEKVSFFRKTAEAVNALNFQECINTAQKTENLAKRIRDGKASVDPEYADIKKDYRGSQIIATQILSGGEEDKRFQATLSLKNIMSLKSPDDESGMPVFNSDLEKQTNEFIKNGKIGKNAAERQHLLSVGQTAFTTNMDEFGIKWNYDRIPVTNEPAKTGTRFQKSLDDSWEYYEKMQDVRMEASLKLQAMKGERYGGRNGSDEYKAMFDALENVAKLSSDSTPNQIEQAMMGLKDAATDYKAKIDKQLLANIRSKGKARYSMANQLIEMSQNAYDELEGLSRTELAPDEKLLDQISRAENNLEMHKQKEAQKRAQKQAQNAQEVQKENEQKQAENVQEPMQKENEPRKEEHRKLDLNEVRDMLKGNAPERKHRNSVREPQQRPAMEKQSEPRKK